MEKRFDIKYNNFLNSLNGLQNTAKNKELSLNDKKSILYDFGGCEEQTWKLFKYYLEYIEGCDNFGNASKKIYRTAKDLNLFEEISEIFADLKVKYSKEFEKDQIDI